MDPLASKVVQIQERMTASRKKIDDQERVIQYMRAAVDAKRRENDREIEKMEGEIRKEEAKRHELDTEGTALQRELAAAQVRVAQRTLRKAV